MRHSRNVLIVGAIVAFSSCAEAQWLDYKTPGIPRTKDGKVDLTAPTPRLANGKPDFSGLWRDDETAAGATSKAMDTLKPKPWAEAVAKKRKEEIYRDAPPVLCLPPGPQVDMGIEKVVQTPTMLVLLYEGTLYREIFLDGRSLEKDPNPDWMGYSVGHWEGDTLVVESNGFNERTWLDGLGHPHTEQLRVTERIRRPDFGHIEMTKTMNDPGALDEPWTVPFKYVYDADTEPLEYVCNENERDRGHLVGKASDDKGVDVPRSVLAEYAGSYEFHPPERPDITLSFGLVIDKDQLMMTGLGPKTYLTALSATQFSTSDGMTFDVVKDPGGKVTHVVAHIVEGDIKAVKTK
jgi:hypothetical protein